MSHPVSRREFVRQGATATTAAAFAAQHARSATAGETAVTFASEWDATAKRVWIGPDYWANPLQDWRIQDGRLECVNAAPDRNVHLLTRDLGPHRGELHLSVRLGRLGGKPFGRGTGSAGFRIGVRGPLDEYRNRLIFGTGLDAGLTSDGRPFIGPVASAPSTGKPIAAEQVTLRFDAVPQGTGYAVTLSVFDGDADKQLAEVRRENVRPEQLVGNVALVANFGRSGGRRNRRKQASGAGTGKFWFADLRATGDKLVAHPERAFGPILFSQYTLSGGTLKMTAQMPPIGKSDAQQVRLETQRDGQWSKIATAPIDPLARTATFRVESWDDSVDTPYRLVYPLRGADGTTADHEWTGTVRRDPRDRDVLSVADISCNWHSAFPNTWCVESTAKLDPDLLAFTGDQFYESSGGYGVRREPVDVAVLDMLHKWFLHGWTWRTLMRDRPSISIPDDHDVYQGNIWGEGGAPRTGTQEMGGYQMPVDWINAVHRTQTSHHPDPPDKTPSKRGISVYYGPLTYGRVSFAILADRQFKSGPQGKVPPTGDRGDHVAGPNVEPKHADVSGLELLGQRQIEFLRHWATDWRGADMKAVISQTIFTAMATTHGADRQRLVADYDANGWPQTPRNDALREIRKAFAFHLAGDQHLPAVVHYGIDGHRDAAVAFAGPAVNSLYPRWFEPEQSGENRAPGGPDDTGDFRDHFDHPITVYAVANPRKEFRSGPLEHALDRASGLGIVRFDKRKRQITVDCWPLLADVGQRESQFDGWPVTIDVHDNYARTAEGYLPTLQITGADNALVQVFEETTGELVYNLRIGGSSFQPHVFAQGRYDVAVSDPESGRAKQLRGLSAAARNDETLMVRL